MLASYARYFALVRSQEEALEAEDLDRFQDLALEREAIQDDLGDQPVHLPDPEAWDMETQEYLETVYDGFRQAVLRDRRIRAHLQTLKKKTGAEFSEVGSRGKKVKGYLETGGAVAESRPSRFNVRL
jgi:hypothetical protein